MTYSVYFHWKALAYRMRSDAKKGSKNWQVYEKYWQNTAYVNELGDL